jgi:hypothetical protein
MTEGTRAYFAYLKPHAYNPDSRDTSVTPRCMCGMTQSYRSHQPLWWRLLNPGVKWR